MPLLSSRIPLFCLLFAGAVAGAQPPRPSTTQPARAAASTQGTAHKAQLAVPESFQISIAFKRTHHGKPVTDRTYLLLATFGEVLPAIRDDEYYRTDAACTAESSTLEHATDVDILTFKPRGKFITIALKISTRYFGLDPPSYLPKLPSTSTHQYLITPTVPIGKRVTVYSNSNVFNDTTVEVKLLIQPFDPNQPDAPEVQP
ncbi:MAG: hypothetical protein WBQ94_27380 [Terracidiphilus sp.]